VGHLYRGIEAGLARLCDRYGEDAVFIGPPGAQAVTATFEWKELTAVTGLASASRAIELIVEQGEGARGDWVKSHFGKFVGILEDFLAMQAADPSFDPARPVEPAYVRLPCLPPVEPIVAVMMMKPVLDHYLALVACLSRQNARSPVRRMLARRRMLGAVA
jgi:Ferritin-like